MKTAKIIRHRHKIVHYVNDEIQSNGIFLEEHFKIIFSHQSEEDDFQRWIKVNNGFYKWDKDTKKMSEESKLPDLDVFKDKGDCFCDVASHYFLVVAGYSFHSALSPYKGEIYVKTEDWETLAK